jgi:hypothetical protein
MPEIDGTLEMPLFQQIILLLGHSCILTTIKPNMHGAKTEKLFAKIEIVLPTEA